MYTCVMGSSSLRVCAPSASDAARIADIHLAAMNSNPLLHAQFPTPSSLARLRDYLEAYTTRELEDRTKGVLVARLNDTNEIISFAKWDCPSHAADATNEKLETGDIKDIEGCNSLYLERYAATAVVAKERYFGDGKCYCRLRLSCPGMYTIEVTLIWVVCSVVLCLYGS